MVLGGDPVFTSLQDQEMKEIEQKLIIARQTLYKTKSGIANRSGNDVGVPPGFSFNLVNTLNFGNFSDGGSKAKTRKVDDFQAVLKECKCGGKVNESNHLLKVSSMTDYLIKCGEKWDKWPKDSSLDNRSKFITLKTSVQELIIMSCGLKRD
ncbi:hypothetical protein MTR_8g464210 [Medicago truncatula]|uniref:Uncharacterized protein n=1 Tax=Medicago truncatula TaxID=3880 RepID=A0A072TRV1_MEDTR|nr:hypothetical protein MTR_8g464210 [Medicago truncatula]